MADIAILVAEEYERRMKASRKIGVIGQAAEPNTTTVAVSGVEKLITASGNGMRSAEEGVVYVEPRSQMGGAAFFGFFSA